MGQTLSRLPFVGATLSLSVNANAGTSVTNAAFRPPISAGGAFEAKVTTTSNLEIKINPTLTAQELESRLQPLLTTISGLQAKVNHLEDELNEQKTTTIDASIVEKFTPFPKLPPELRSKIWQLARDEPRLMGVRFVLKKNSDSAEILAATARTHALLRTIRESRSIALKALVRLNKDEDLVPAVFFNQPYDTLWLTNFTPSRGHSGKCEICCGDSFWATSPEIHSIAMPFQTWIELQISNQRKVELQFDLHDIWGMTSWLKWNVKEIVLIAAGKDLARSYSPLLIKPRSNLHFLLPNDEWLRIERVNSFEHLPSLEETELHCNYVF